MFTFVLTNNTTRVCACVRAEMEGWARKRRGRECFAHKACSGVTLANARRAGNAQVLRWLLLRERGMIRGYGGQCLASRVCSGATLANVSRAQSAQVVRWLMFGVHGVRRRYAG